MGTLIKDVAERSIWTFLQAFLAVFVFTGTAADLDAAKAAGIAGVAAVLAMLKGFVANYTVRSSISPASTAPVPRRPDTGQTLVWILVVALAVIGLLALLGVLR